MLPERFWFPGAVPDAELAAYYRNAHAYVSLSEHEGFCVPLVEAMAMDVPVLAYARGGGAGDAGRRRRVVRAEGSRVRRRAARRPDLRRAASGSRSSPASGDGVTRFHAGTASKPRIREVLAAVGIDSTIRTD